MKIAMVGSGYVGLVSGACFADFGHDVVCIDKDEKKIAALENGVMPIYEPGLDALVETNVKAGRLSFTTDLAEGIDGADAIFIAVGTPSRRGDGHADLTFVYAVAKEIGATLRNDAVVVTKSTVPVGTGREVAQIIGRARPDASFDVASNPEFLREGFAIHDTLHPDRIVLGVQRDSRLAEEAVRDLYAALLADGVAKEDLYPLDLDRAYAKLDEIKPHIAVWWKTGNQVQQIMRDNEVALTMAYSGRALKVIQDGSPFAMAWDGAIRDTGYLAVLKNSPNTEGAMKFIDFFYGSAEGHPGFIQAVGYATSSTIGLSQLPEEEQKLYATYPANYELLVDPDFEWIGAHRDELRERWTNWLLQ